jgi:hypothetical protein
MVAKISVNYCRVVLLQFQNRHRYGYWHARVCDRVTFLMFAISKPERGERMPPSAGEKH